MIINKFHNHFTYLYEIFLYNDLNCNPVRKGRNRKINAIKNAKIINFETLKLILVIPIKTHENRKNLATTLLRFLKIPLSY